MSHRQGTDRLVRNLAGYTNGSYHPGRGFITRSAWWLISLAIFESGLVPLYWPKRILLRLFGAQVGQQLIIKTHVRIKHPWRLTIGNNCWIGQEVWIDNLGQVTIEDDVAVSQQAYLCTGSHNHRSPTFDMIVKPIVLETGCWVCARATILGGSRVRQLEVVPAGTVRHPRDNQRSGDVSDRRDPARGAS